MPSNSRKVSVQVALDIEKEYKQKLESLSAGNRVLSSELKKLQAEYKGNTESAEYLTKAGDVLQRELLTQQDKVKALKDAMKFMADQYGESSDKAMRYQTQLNKAEAEVFDLQHAIEENTEALQNQDEEMETVSEDMAGLGDTVNDLASKLGINLPQGATKALNGMKGLSTGTVAAMGAAVAGIAAVIKVVKELGQLTLDVAAQVDEYLSQEQITGVPAQMLQAWDYAAPLIDVDASTITGSMTKLTKAMGDAAGGSESVQAKFKELGVSIYDSNGELRSSEEVFYDVIDALGNIENQTERDAAAMELLGKSAQDLNPLINAGSQSLKDFAAEAEAVGYILNEDQLEALSAVDDAYQELKLSIEATKKQLAAEFAPAAEEAMELFRDVVLDAGKALIDSGIIESLASVLQELMQIFRTAGDILSSIPGFNNGLQTVKNVLNGIAQVCALISDSANVIAGIVQFFSGDFSGGLEKIGIATGWGKKSGNASNLQRVQMQQAGTWDQYSEFYANKNGTTTREGLGYDPTVGYYDLKTGNIIGWNASGNDNWRGGLTWVGESGPELVALPRGSQVYNSQDSQQLLGGDTFYISIDAASVKEFNDIVELAKSARVRSRMR